MFRAKYGAITLGVFIIIVVIVILLYAINETALSEVIPLIIAFYGCWLIVYSGIRTQIQSQYMRSAFSYFGWGMLLAAIGFGYDFFIRSNNILYPLVVVLLLLGILGIVGVLKPTGKKA
jgi:hypothetical protein